MAGVGSQFLLTGTNITKQKLLEVPLNNTGAVDIYIMNIAALRVECKLWTTTGDETTADESGMLEYRTPLSTGDYIQYTGKPVIPGEKIWIEITPLSNTPAFKVSVQVKGFLD